MGIDKGGTLGRILTGAASFEYIDMLFWDGKFEEPLRKGHSISICTTAMDRLEDVQKTLEKNIQDNASYPDIEFVLLDYNSKDGLSKWIKARMMGYIEDGILNYYRTEEPKYYSMAHSRNLAFRLARGQIVNNVDADSFTCPGFAGYINKLANQIPDKCIFAKGRRMIRGRLGFYKDEFINSLGGYDESFEGYGHDDHDIVHRAWGLGFKMAWFGSKYFSKTESPKHQTSNYKDKNWKYTEMRNKTLSFLNIALGKFRANMGVPWGTGTVVKNFTEEVTLS